MSDIPLAVDSPGPKPTETQKNILGRIKDKIARKKATPLSEQQIVRTEIKREALFTQKKTDISERYSRKAKEFTGKYEWVGVTESVKNQYRRFLEQYLSRAIEVYDINPGIFENAQHAYEKQILNMLTDESIKELSDRTEVVSRTINQDKLKKLLESPQGLMITTQLLEQQIALEMFAVGLNASVTHATTTFGRRTGGERDMNVGGNDTVIINYDQGVLNKLAREYLDPREAVFWSRSLGGAGGGTLGALIGKRIAGTFGGGAGALIGAGIGVRGGLITALKTGVMVDMRQCTAALAVAQGNQAEAQYIREMYGIDVNDYQAVGPNQIQRSPGRVSETSRVDQRDNRSIPSNERIDPLTIRNELLENIYTRFEFFLNMKVPIDLLDAIPEQALYNYQTGDLEKTGAKWIERITQTFQPNTGGIRDLAGNAMDNPAFNAANLDFTGNLQRFMDARRQVMTQMIGDYIRREAEGTDPTQSRLTLLGAHKESRGTTGDLRATRVRESETRKNRMQEDLGRTRTGRQSFDAYRDSSRGLQQLRMELQNEFPGIVNIDGEITTMRNQIIDIRNQERELRLFRRHAVQDEIRAAYPDGVPSANYDAVFNRYLEDTEPLFQPQFQDLEERRTEINTRLTRLNTLRTGITQQERALTQGENEEVIENLSTYLRTLTADYQTLTSWGITHNELLILPIEDILTRVNNANGTNVDFGWPQGANERPENRTKVINAIVEARTQSLATATFGGADAMPDFNTVRALNISENQLRTLPIEQLQRIINQINGTNPTLGWPENENGTNELRLQNAIDQANSFFVSRIRVYDDLEQNLGRMIDREDNIISGVNFEQDIRTIEMTEALLTNQSRVSEKLSLIPDEEGFARYIERAPVDPNDTMLAPAERAQYNGAQLQQGYLEFMDNLFDYRMRPDRDQYFQRVVEFLPPDRFVRMFRDHSDVFPVIAGGAVGVTTIDDLFDLLEFGYNNSLIGNTELISGFRRMINNIANETLAQL